MDKLKALVVDDSVVYRKIISAAVDGTEMAKVEATASNGVLAIERLEHGKYDVVLLDVNMPEMDGIETLKQIKRRWTGIPVIMISGTGGKNAEVTLKALEIGALDFIMKPLDENYEKNMEIVQRQLKILFAEIKVKSFKSVEKSNKIEKNYGIVNTEKYKNKVSISGVDIVLIASSTGGPIALEKVFTNFPKGFHKPILVVQHMPPDFTNVLAENLNKKSNINIIEGKAGDVLRAGQAIIAPGGIHMIMDNSKNSVKQIQLVKSEFVNGVRPAADVLFKSVAQVFKGSKVLVVVLTGMGNDGMEGVKELKRNCKCYCITQNEQSCVVYGMPRSVNEAGLSDECLDINQIAARIATISEFGS